MRAQDFVASYIDAWNHRDPQAVASHLAPDGYYRDVPENIQQTRAELIVTLREFFTEFPHRYELIGEILASNNTIAYQYRMCPQQDRRMNGSAKPIRGAEFITLHGDSAISIIDYYDSPQTERPVHLAHATSRNDRQLKYAKSGLTNAQLCEYKDRLESLMRVDQVYLRPDLSLPKLAQALGCSVNHVSQVINAGFSMSFFDYVNRYRIHHAQQLLAEADARSAVLNIAFSVGFNSNSAFYAAFKKHVGLTPAQFRRERDN
ncbi:MAG: nuclear transport factor 2 family protein [Woeseiaceae bacterium]|nr:nuclear transport factor 2 family protein [Woeseiaceae bacterium]